MAKNFLVVRTEVSRHVLLHSSDSSQFYYLPQMLAQVLKKPIDLFCVQLCYYVKYCMTSARHSSDIYGCGSVTHLFYANVLCMKLDMHASFMICSGDYLIQYHQQRNSLCPTLS